MKKEVKFIHGLIPVLALAVAMLSAVVLWGAEPQIPLAVGCMAAGIVAWRLGWTWDEILAGMLDGIKQSLEAVLILMAIGILISMWVAAGTVPAMIYWGLHLISPKAFLPGTFLLCSLISMFVGAWGAAGTVGIAFIGIGQTLGMPLPMVAGAIVAGSYVGDKMSPFSDGTNLAAVVSSANIFEMIRHMIPIALPVWGISAVMYLFLGLRFAPDEQNMEEILAPMTEGLSASFCIGMSALIPLVVMLICVVLKWPSLVAILTSAISGAIVALTSQSSSPAELLTFANAGYLSQTGIAELDKLLSTGGIYAMMRTISIILVAMAFGGLMRSTGQMDALISPVIRRIRSTAALIVLTVCSCIGVNIVAPDQYLGISVPGQMYAAEFERRGLANHTLGNVLGAGAAVTSPLVPWNTCGVYMTSILGVATLQYVPFALFNLLLPIAMVAWGIVRFGRKKA